MKVGQQMTNEKMISHETIQEKAVLIGIRTGRQVREEAKESWKELEALVDAAGAAIVESVYCEIQQIRSGTYLGTGKIEEIRELVQETGADIVALDVQLSPPQQRNLEKAWEVRVIDRTGIILDIFADRAATNEGKLQVELAQLEYRLPRLTRMWEHLGRLGAGIGTRGPGETQLEVDRRRIRTRLDKLRSELAKTKARRRLQRAGRKRSGIPTVAIVGYTNAGKSTLLNLLTGAEALVKDQVFATLDPTIRQLNLPNQQKLILSDTVGFISKLPHELVAAFHATLEEVIEADLLLHVVDASNFNRDLQIRDVETVLKELGADGKPMFTVFNKIDLDTEWQAGKIECGDNLYAISAKDGTGISALLDGLMFFQSQHTQLVEFFIPYSDSRFASKIREHCQVKSEEFEADGIRLKVISGSAILNKFGRFIVGD